jgi:hypothetical protein
MPRIHFDTPIRFYLTVSEIFFDLNAKNEIFRKLSGYYGNIIDITFPIFARFLPDYGLETHYSAIDQILPVYYYEGNTRGKRDIINTIFCLELFDFAGVIQKNVTSCTDNSIIIFSPLKFLSKPELDIKIGSKTIRTLSQIV